MTSIQLRQHGGPAVLSRRDYDDLWASSLAKLEQYRILKVRVEATSVLVYPNQFAGFARTDAGTVRIEPRFPDLLEELKRTFPRQTASVPGSGFDASANTTVKDSVAAALSGMAEVAAAGMPFDYGRVRQEASVPRGSFDLGSTIRSFASKGIAHRVVSQKSVREVDQDLLKICRVAADLMTGDGLIGERESRLLDRLQTSLGFADVSAVTVASALDLIEHSRRRWSDRTDVDKLLMACRELLELAESAEDVEAAVGRTSFRFADTDALWERAVQAALSQLLPVGSGLSAELHPLRGSTTTLFPNGGPNIDPDVLVSDRMGPCLIVDAKDYLAKGSDSSSVYQVASYARSLGAKRALLVYLSPSATWSSAFGDSTVNVHSIGVAMGRTSTLANLRDACRPIVEMLVGEVDQS